MSRIYLLLGSLASGILFGIGLAISQMTNPEKVKNFLDFAAMPNGGWDPSLAYVMGGGVIVAWFGLRNARRKPAIDVDRPSASIDRPLVVGSTVFGLGWGLSGFCPGPAFADLGLIPGRAALFVAALLAGSWATGWLLNRRGPLGTLPMKVAAE